MTAAGYNKNMKTNCKTATGKTTHIGGRGVAE